MLRQNQLEHGQDAFSHIDKVCSVGTLMSSSDLKIEAIGTANAHDKPIGPQEA